MLVIKEEVKQALEENRPVVALESTIITHGMPYPENIQTAKEVENILREQGVVPATIAIIDGVMKIGLSEEELEALAQAKDVVKTSRRDIPYILANKKSGASTVAATMIMAKMAGIKVFVTGGIGGVHRGASESFDISADLMELAQTDVAVVCAGTKSILDIEKSLEVLETHGVPVFGYQTEEFPAFYTRKSGFKVEYSLASAEEAAAILKTKWDLGLKGGVVIANPIPKEDALDQEYIDGSIEKAIETAEKLGIKGKEMTPFLLDELKRVTEGKSLQANIALVYNNARIGGQIAKELARLEREA